MAVLNFGAISGLGVRLLAGVSLVAASFALTPAPVSAQENGIGADPDGDSNPATVTKRAYRGGAEAEAELDPPFQIITFEPPPGKHGIAIAKQYKKTFGVEFSKGVQLQVCEGQRYFQYNSACTYLAPPSGKYAGVYSDDFRRPLQVKFDAPVCAASLGVYPTGGKEGERFRATIEFFEKDGEDMASLGRETTDFTWTRNTFRWRVFVEKFLEGDAADLIEVSIRSLDNRSSNVSFLIDDLAFIESTGGGSAPCDAQLSEVIDAAPYVPTDVKVEKALEELEDTN